MSRKSMLAIGIATVWLAGLGGLAISAQDSGEAKYTVKVPGGLAFSEFRGYEDWLPVAVSQTEDRLKVIVANPVMIDAYRAGVPGNGQPFPDGAKIAKIEWKPKANAEAPFPVNVPDTLDGIGLMEKDSERFPDTGGWGYAQLRYDPASDTYRPHEEFVGDAKCGHVCHVAVEAKDYVFTAYGKR
jgi:hypothetical protein